MLKKSISLLLVVIIFCTSFYPDFLFMEKTVQAEEASDQQEHLEKAASATDSSSSNKYSNIDDLKSLIAKARSLANAVNTYPQGSLADLKETLNFIESLVKESPDDIAVSMYIDTINELIVALVPGSQTGKVDKAALLQIIGTAEKLSPNDYSIDSWKRMKSLLDNAKEIQMSTKNVQELVNTMVVKLQDSINALVDLRELKVAIAREIGFVSSKYTLASWNTVQVALNNAKAVLTKSNATAEEVIAAAYALNTAFNNLELYKVDKTALLQIIGVADELSPNDYTIDSWERMKSLLDNAKELQVSTENVQEPVDIIVVKLQNSINALVDLRELKIAIAREIGLDSRKYTIASWNTVQIVLNNAKAVLNKSNATAEEVTAAAYALNTAFNNLILREIDKTALLQIIGVANELSPNDYTIDSWESMKSLLDNAKEIQMGTENIQELVDIIVVKLQDSINALVDLRELKTAIAREIGLVSSRYTLASWKPAQIALNDAKAVLNKSNATSEEIIAAAFALNTAFNNLILISELPAGEALLQLIGIADELSPNDYTIDSWESMKLLLENAKEIQRSTENVQESVNIIVVKLQDSIDALVDLRGLKKAIAREIGLDSSNYTLLSWYTAQILLYDAKAVLNKSNATAEEVTAAADAVNTAFNSLILKINKDNLKMAITEVESYDTSLYTTLSVLIMKLALSDAKKIYNGAGYSQSEVDAAELALKNAVAALVPQVNKKELKALITSTSAISSSNYTFVSWYNLRLAISAATTVANDANATQAQVDEQVTLLKAAEAALILK